MEKNRDVLAFCDNAIVHFYPNSPCVGKCSVNLRRGNRIVLRLVLRDQYALEEAMKHINGVLAWGDKGFSVELVPTEN